MEKLMIFLTHGRRLRFRDIITYVNILLNFIFWILISNETAAVTSLSCHEVQCVHGVCKEGRCVCDQGWQGTGCHRCGGRVRYIYSLLILILITIELPLK